MGIVLLVIAVLLVVLIALVAVPVDVVFDIDRVSALEGQVKIRWLFGLVRFRIGIPGTARAKVPTPGAEPANAGKAGTRREKAGALNIPGVLKQAAFRRRCYQFIRDIFRAAHSHDFYLRLRLGLGDPADTGRVWAWLGPISTMATNIRGARLLIEPEFMDPVLEFESHGEFRLVPIEFIALVVAFVLSPPSVRAWRTLRRGNA